MSQSSGESAITPPLELGKPRRIRFDNRYVAPLFITCILLVGHLSYGILESYDKTVLIFVGDHGARFDPRLVEVESRRRSRPGTVPVATSNSFGLPLVLVKPIGAAEPLTISDAPVSLADIPRTVTSVLGLPSSLPGKSMLDPVDDAPRARRVLKYESGAQRVAHAYFPVLTEYEVSGFSWLDESWRPTGRQFLPGKAQLQSTAAPYRLGHALRFGIGGNGAAYLSDGWAVPEAASRRVEPTPPNAKPTSTVAGNASNARPTVVRSSATMTARNAAL